MARHRSPLKHLPNGVVLLGFTSLLTDIASDAIYPLLPIYLMTVLHAPVISLGIIEGIAEATASLVKLGSGLWSDRLGKNKLLVFTGYMVSNLTKPMLAITQNWGQVLVVRWSDRVGKGIRSAPRDAWLAKLATRETLNVVYGFHRGMDNAGAFVGPMLASLYLLFYPGQYRSLFMLTLVPGILAIAFVALVREYGKRQKRQVEWSLGVWWDLPRQLKYYLAIIFLFTLGNSSDTFLLLRLKTGGIDAVWLPFLWGMLHVVKMLTSFASGPIADKIGARRCILIGWLVYVGVYAAMAVVHAKAWLVAIFLGYGLFFGFTEGPERAIIAKLAPKTMQGAAFGFYAMMLGLAALPASLLFGALWTWTGMPSAFLTGAALAVSALFLLWLYFEEPA